MLRDVSRHHATPKHKKDRHAQAITAQMKTLKMHLGYTQSSWFNKL